MQDHNVVCLNGKILPSCVKLFTLKALQFSVHLKQIFQIQAYLLIWKIQLFFVFVSVLVGSTFKSCPQDFLPCLLAVVAWTLLYLFPHSLSNLSKCFSCLAGETTMLEIGLALHSMACCHGLRSTRFLFLNSVGTVFR